MLLLKCDEHIDIYHIQVFFFFLFHAHLELLGQMQFKTLELNQLRRAEHVLRCNPVIVLPESFSGLTAILVTPYLY